MSSVKGGEEVCPSLARLEKKLRRGKTLEQAASEAGVDLDEAKKWLEAKRALKGFDDDTLALVGAEALHYGVKTLIELSKIREGRVGTETEQTGSGEDRTSTTTKFDHPDLGAAQELVRTAMKIRQLIAPKAKGARDEEGEDLFDGAPVGGELWEFPKRD